MKTERGTNKIRCGEVSEGAIVWDKRKVFVALCYTCRGMDVVESCVEGRDVYDQNIIFFNNLSCDTLMLRTEAVRGNIEYSPALYFNGTSKKGKS